MPLAKASPGSVKINAVYRTASGYYPQQATGSWLYVKFDIESPYAWDLTSNGIVGYTFDLQVDPAVLTVWSVHASTFDYFLYDCVDWNQDPFGPFYGTNYPSLLVGELNRTTGNVIDIAEFIMGYEDVGVGAGGNSYPEDFWYGAGNGLVMLRCRVADGAGYSPIDISDAAYWTPDGTKHTIPDGDITDGHYNVPPVPEFPLGAAVEVGLIVAVVYIWWTRRRKLKEVPYR
jgi:hypothetical protein